MVIMWSEFDRILGFDEFFILKELWIIRKGIQWLVMCFDRFELLVVFFFYWFGCMDEHFIFLLHLERISYIYKVVDCVMVNIVVNMG